MTRDGSSGRADGGAVVESRGFWSGGRKDEVLFLGVGIGGYVKALDLVGVVVVLKRAFLKAWEGPTVGAARLVGEMAGDILGKEVPPNGSSFET